MGRKLNNKTVKSRYKKLGLTVIGTYINCETSLKYKCNNCKQVFDSPVPETIMKRKNEWCSLCVKTNYKKYSISKGEKFGKLTTLNTCEKNDDYWICKCDCGNTTRVNVYLLLDQHTQSCDCLRKKRARDSRWTGYKEISGKYWKSVIANAKRRKINFNVSIEDIWNIYIRQNKLCALSGTKLILHIPGKKSTFSTASLDRIDSFGIYEIGNLQWIHKAVNDMKWHLSIDRFIELCKFVIMPMDNNQKTEECIEKTHHFNWKGHGNISGHEWCIIKRNATLRKINFDISIQYAWKIFYEQNGRCAITGLPLLLHPKRTASLDRINSSLPYIKSNVRWVHKNINRCLKKERSDKEMLKWCKKIVEYNRG